MAKLILRGPCGARVVLDREKVNDNDPGADTPAIVEWRGHSGTFWCCADTGEIDAGDATLPQEVTDWLNTLHDRVNTFLYRNED